MVDQAEDSMKGWHSHSQGNFEVWFKSPSGWYWEETMVPHGQGHGPFNTSREAYDGAVVYMNELRG